MCCKIFYRHIDFFQKRNFFPQGLEVVVTVYFFECFAQDIRETNISLGIWIVITVFVSFFKTDSVSMCLESTLTGRLHLEYL